MLGRKARLEYCFHGLQGLFPVYRVQVLSEVKLEMIKLKYVANPSSSVHVFTLKVKSSVNSHPI